MNILIIYLNYYRQLGCKHVYLLVFYRIYQKGIILVPFAIKFTTIYTEIKLAPDSVLALGMRNFVLFHVSKGIEIFPLITLLKLFMFDINYIWSINSVPKHIKDNMKET